jgi:transcriptional regulator GlxA family with amidase domain
LSYIYSMKHVSVLTLQDATITSIDSSHQILSRINDLLKYSGKAPYYNVELVGAEKNITLNKGLYNIQVNKTLREVTKTDVIVIPLLCGDFSKAGEQNAPYRDWVIAQYHGGAEIVCLCVGAFFLASTGLLNGRKCAIHWAAKNEFTAMFPEVNVVEDTIITAEHGIYTCGGGYSYLNLLLYIIEKQVGRPMSVLASKMFEIDIERKSQHPFMIFMGQKQHGEKNVLQAQELMENNPTEVFSVEEICTKLGVGRRTFERKFRQCTGNSVAEYIQRVKVEFTKQQLEAGTKNVNEIIYEIGYNDINAFRKIFKRHVDLTPVEYRKKYRG